MVGEEDTHTNIYTHTYIHLYMHKMPQEGFKNGSSHLLEVGGGRMGIFLCILFSTFCILCLFKNKNNKQINELIHNLLLQRRMNEWLYHLQPLMSQGHLH